MAPKKTNIKIKRSKFNLYNKKKSKAKRALKVILTIVVVCGLGVLGYGLGKPLLKFIKERGQNSSSLESDTSALLSSIMNAGSTQISSGEASGSGSVAGSSGGTGQTPEHLSSEKVYYLPENAAENTTSLKSALETAKKSGCSVVAVTLKDTTGFLLYKTSYASVKDTETVKGTLTASQIASEITKAGFTPAARISTLMDRTGAVYAEAHYHLGDPNGSGSWLDNRPDNGGKAWMSPFRQQASAYIEHIAGELSGAGFKRIICVNTRYPAFHASDISSYLSKLPLKDSAKRVEALWNVVNAAKKGADKSGAELWLELSATNLIAENRDCTDAELITDKAKIKSVKLVVNYDIAKPAASTPAASTKPAASSSNAPVASTTSGVSNGAGASRSTAADDYQTAKSFISKAKTALGGAEFAVRLPQTLTGKALEDVTRAFTEAGVPVV